MTFSKVNDLNFCFSCKPDHIRLAVPGCLPGNPQEEAGYIHTDG